MAGDSNGPPRLSPRDAWRRFLNHKRTDVRESTLTSYRYRLKLFVEWCEGQGIEFIDELDGWTLDEYENYRAGITAPITLQKEMNSIKNLLEYLERIEVVSDLADKVHVPHVQDEDKTDDTHLADVDALELLRYYRNEPAVFGSRYHVILELAWNVGARRGGLRALDVRDVDTDEHYVEFHHRPQTGTPLKNGKGHHPVGGERFVGISVAVSEAVNRYVDHHRHEVHDEHGRQPLLTTPHGRISVGVLAASCYRATIPCQYSACPHGKDSDDCEWTWQSYAHACPSSRAPHQVRTGSIMWQRDRGLPAPVVAERANASIDTIERYYDHQTSRERMERRRRSYVDHLHLDNEDNSE